MGPSVEVSHTVYWLSKRRARSTKRVWCHGASAVITTTSDNSFLKPVSNNLFEIAVGGVFLFCLFGLGSAIEYNFINPLKALPNRSVNNMFMCMLHFGVLSISVFLVHIRALQKVAVLVHSLLMKRRKGLACDVLNINTFIKHACLIYDVTNTDTEFQLS